MKRLATAVIRSVTKMIEIGNTGIVRARFRVNGARDVDVAYAAAYAWNHGWRPRDTGFHSVTLTRAQLLQAYAQVHCEAPWSAEIIDTQFALTLCAKLGLDERKSR